jgi:hypothetical protein
MAMHEQIEPGVFVVRYHESEDLAPERQGPLMEQLKAASRERRIALLFVVGPDVRSVDGAVPSFWLAATSDPALRLAALGVVSPNVGVRMATSGFGAANVVRGMRFRVRSFSAEHEGVVWALAAVRRATAAAA